MNHISEEWYKTQKERNELLSDLYKDTTEIDSVTQGVVIQKLPPQQFDVCRVIHGRVIEARMWLRKRDNNLVFTYLCLRSNISGYPEPFGIWDKRQDPLYKGYPLFRVNYGEYLVWPRHWLFRGHLMVINPVDMRKFFRLMQERS